MKCCQSNTVNETAFRSATAPEEPVKVVDAPAVEEEAATEAEKVEVVTDAEAEEKAAESSYTCCGVF